MKRYLCLALATLLTCAQMGQAQEEGQNKRALELEYAVGFGSSQNAITLYYAINSLADAFVAETFTKEQSIALVDIYLNNANSMAKSLRDLVAKIEFTPADKKALNGMIKLFDTLSKQATALKSIMESGDEAEGGAEFQKHRKAAQALMDEVFGTELSSDEPATKEEPEPAPAPTKKKKLLDE